MKPIDLVPMIHAAPLRGVLAMTGGGTGALPNLLTTPGASATVLEAIVPYAATALTDWLGCVPERACDEATSRAMAMRAFLRARLLDPSADARALFGLGATASLATNRPKRGEHRAHVAVQTANATRRLTLRFEKGKRSRADEEETVAHAAIALLAAVAGVHAIDLSRTPPGIEAEFDETVACEEETELLLGERPVVPWHGAPSLAEAAVTPVCLLPGSFNPPHRGHDEIARIAADRLGRDVVFELSIENVDKPPLDYFDLKQRTTALDGRAIWLTRAATFIDKARLAPRAVFAVGADTIERIGEPRYYRADPAQRDAAVAELARLGCRFLVFGRIEGDRFIELDDLNLPSSLRALCEGVSESEFREDVSSTDLREQS